jgi:hypothetical protein
MDVRNGSIPVIKVLCRRSAPTEAWDGDRALARQVDAADDQLSAFDILQEAAGAT